MIGQNGIFLLTISLFVSCCTSQAYDDMGKGNREEWTPERSNYSSDIPPKNISKRQTPGSAGCSYNFQFNAVNQSANLNSPNYPNDYPANVDCRYTITSPPGTQMKMDCYEFNVESSSNCQYDVFFLSLSGDATFSDQEFYCGAGKLLRTSRSNKLTIGFHSDGSNPVSSSKYRFQCLLTVVGTPTPPCTCGGRNDAPATRIVGGTEAFVGEFPWRCALYTISDGVFCGCTIISSRWVMTATHCSKNVQPGNQIYVDVGDHNLEDQNEAKNEVIPVDKIIENPQYNEDTQDSDIAVLRLATPLTFKRNISPVCLPWNFVNSNFNGQQVTASGWGLNFFGGTPAKTLRKVDLSVLETAQCRKYRPTITDNMICTYTPGKDTCQGDSGGSIDWRDGTSGRYYALGITSQGVGCGSTDNPGVYTKVTKLLNWIQTSTGETFCRV